MQIILIDDIPTFDVRSELCFDWNSKLENISLLNKCNPKDLAFRKAQGTVIKCLKYLSADVSWNNETVILRKQFSLVPIVIHATTWLMHRYQQKGEILQEFNFEFSEIIQAVTNHEPTDINLHVHAHFI